MGVFYEYAAHFMNRGSLINVALERRTAAVGGRYNVQTKRDSGAPAKPAPTPIECRTPDERAIVELYRNLEQPLQAAILQLLTAMQPRLRHHDEHRFP
jgi:hypothetical protein